jgi:hypothetical protein
MARKKRYRWRQTHEGGNNLELVSRRGEVRCTVSLVDPKHPRHRWEAIYWPPKHPKVGYYKSLAEAQKKCERGTVRDIYKD